MREIVITASFRDKDNFDRIYSVGEVVSVSEERAQYLIGLGYAKAYDEAPKAKPAELTSDSLFSDKETKKSKNKEK